MKITKLILCALFATVLAAVGLVGCEEPDVYEIAAPADLQARIDSIAAAKAGVDTGDTTHITINTTIVGAEDNSSAWWTAFSDYFKIPTNKLLHLEFINKGSGVNNWNNWNLAVANEVGDRDAEGYAEYFVLRSDAFGWGNGDYDGSMISQNYPDTDGDGDVWNDFRATMQGAYVTIEVDHSATGNAYVTATAVGTNGVTLVQTYQQPVSATADIVAFLVADGSYFQIKKAYLLPSKVTAVEDVNPVSIAVEGAPEFVEMGDEDFWGNAVATVTFADGSSEQVNATDLSFNVIPDMTTLGVKTVIVAYSKTKQGAFTQAVSTFYTLEVTTAVSSLAVTTMPDITTYYYFNSDPIIFNTKGLVVTATYSDGTTGVLPNSELQFGTIPAAAGAQAVNITYEGAGSTVTTTVPLTLVQGTSQVGATNFSTAWWTAFSEDYPVASGSSKTITMYCYSNNVANWNSPSTILRKADNTEYAVVRMDSFGWGGGYGTATLSSDWNWDTFTSNISGSKVVIKVTNNGDDTADIRYDVTYATGETHFQEYAGITVDSDDVNFAFVTEGAYLVIVE
ncbi:MAG TPA: bacterial Ig-like domain-containing protein [Ohtaekwangia sp.]|nr:bacterial Ig-like domain-containing protein [Ohtaekwangia sp.]